MRAISRRTPSKPERIDRVRRVVDDEVDAGEVLEGADVAALAADDAALHVVGLELDDGDRRLGGVAGGQALHDDREDVAHAPLGVALGLLLDLAQAAGRVVAHLVLELLHQHRLGLRRRQARERARARARPSRAPRSSCASFSAEPALALGELGRRGRRAPPRGRAGAPRGAWPRRGAAAVVARRRRAAGAGALARPAAAVAAAGRFASSAAATTRPRATTAPAITISIAFPLPGAVPGGAARAQSPVFAGGRPSRVSAERRRQAGRRRAGRPVRWRL